MSDRQPDHRPEKGQRQNEGAQGKVDTFVRSRRSQSWQNQSRDTKAKKKETIEIPRRAVYIVLAAVCVLLLIYGATQLSLKRQDTKRTEEINEQNRALLGTDEPQTPVPERTEEALPGEDAAEPTPAPQDGELTPAPTEGTASPYHRIVKGEASPVPQTQRKFRDLIAANKDFCGWLKTDAVYRIDFAVVKRDNEFYMTHDFSGASNREGAAFLDETNVLWPRDDNLIIYAHNMKSGSMFGELNLMSRYDVLRRNPFTSFDTLYENGEYVPFAVINCDVADPKAENYFNFYLRNFKTVEEFDAFISRARKLSILDLSQVDVQAGDPLLTLSTCFDDANKTRFIVMLRKLRAGETREALQAKWFDTTGSQAQ